MPRSSGTALSKCRSFRAKRYSGMHPCLLNQGDAITGRIGRCQIFAYPPVNQNLGILDKTSCLTLITLNGRDVLIGDRFGISGMVWSECRNSLAAWPKSFAASDNSFLPSAIHPALTFPSAIRSAGVRCLRVSCSLARSTRQLFESRLSSNDSDPQIVFDHRGKPVHLVLIFRQQCFVSLDGG